MGSIFKYITNLRSVLPVNFPIGSLIINGCPSRKSYPQVAMMQSGQDLCGDDGPRSLDGSSSRRVLAQPQVRARLIVVERIKSQDPS
jgi:hypothetical protein